MPMHEALQYSRGDDSLVHCSLCNHRCSIQEGKRGICGVRENLKGTLYATTYARVSAEAVDPIEKKPLFHFLPGTTSYSLGSVGCNFHCEHCQNWHISRRSHETTGLTVISPQEGAERARGRGCASISWTYNEPTIWHEYPLDMGRIARKMGLGTIYVTNGYITEEALRELSPMLNAFRVDIKSFSEDFYKKICGARLQPVLDSAALAKELGMHVETVTLVIPGLNDSPGETGAVIQWVVENLGPETPMHFTRFHPDYRMKDVPVTPVALMEKIYGQARSLGVKFPYLGNVFEHRFENTYCPVCNALLIERVGYSVRFIHLDGHRCTSCGEDIPVVTDVPPA